jgi:rod shape-determining protein MreD
MIKKVIITLSLIYLLIMLQTSFLPHFSFWGITPNYVLILVVFITLFERSGKLGIWAALAGGLLNDIFYSSMFFGFYSAIFFSIWLFIHLFLRKYVQVPNIKKI